MTHLPALPAGPTMYAVLVALIIASSLPMASFVFPAEPFLFAAVLLSCGSGTSVVMLLVVAMGSALAGDVLSYWVGRRFGTRLLNARGVHRFRGRVTTAAQTVRRRGALGAVVLQRWVPPGRGFVPAIIGGTDAPFGRFVGSAVAAATLWSTVMVLGVHYGGMHLVMTLPVVMTVLLVARVAHLIVRRMMGRRGDAAASPAERKTTVIGRHVSVEGARPR
ncbi:DedA family protein [Mycobacterium sp. MMS18-G62]